MGQAEEKLALAKRHLERVQVAWDPPDWPDLSLYGFYALENAVEAASLHLGIALQKTHVSRVNAAAELHRNHGFPDVSGLLRDLNETRKSMAYGEVTGVVLDPEDIASDIETYIALVGGLLDG